MLMTIPPKINSNKGRKSTNSSEVHGTIAAGGLTCEESVKNNCSSCSSSPKSIKRLVLNVQIPKDMNGENEIYLGGEVSTKKKKRKNKKKCKKTRQQVKSNLDAHHHELTDNGEDNYDSDDLGATTFQFPMISFALKPGQTSLLDYSLVIPPLPKSYDVWDTSMYFSQPVESPKTREEENELILEGLRKVRFFKSQPIKIPKWDLSRANCYGITTRGTILIRLKDEWNLAHFNNLARRLRYCAGAQKMIRLDARIKKEDVTVGLLVMAYIKRKDGWIRARINKFTRNWIEVSGVDEFLPSERLRYDDVLYLRKDLCGCPFQIQECYLSGLEKWKMSPLIQLMWSKLEGILRMNEEFRRKNSDDDKVSGDGDGDEDKNQLDLFTEDFWVSEIENREGKYYVKVDFPEEFSSELSVNDWIKLRLENFDPIQDLQKTP